jgi:hypothetical protein
LGAFPEQKSVLTRHSVVLVPVLLLFERLTAEVYSSFCFHVMRFTTFTGALGVFGETS